MNDNKNLYEILGVDQKSSIEEIKKKFRKLALIHHPDKNNNSISSEIIFKIIYNAYETLISTEQRNAYDIYLLNTKKTKKDNTLFNNDNGFLKNLCKKFNFIFWEIEDILNSIKKDNSNKIYDGLTIEQWLLKILIFIDEWVLTPLGFEDYFYKSRKIINKRSFRYLSNNSLNIHKPYVNSYDYFYEIRKRLDKFINKIKPEEILKNMDDYPVKIIDNIFEAQRLSYHYLGLINLIMKNTISQFKEFHFSRSCYNDNKNELISYDKI